MLSNKQTIQQAKNSIFKPFILTIPLHQPSNRQMQTNPLMQHFAKLHQPPPLNRTSFKQYLTNP